MSLRGLPRLRFSGVIGMPADVDGNCDVPDAADCGRLLSVDSTSTKSFSGELARLICLAKKIIKLEMAQKIIIHVSLTFLDVSLSSTSAHVSSISASILARS